MIPMRRGFDSSTCIFDENVLVPALVLTCPPFTAQICIVRTSNPVKLFDFLYKTVNCFQLEWFILSFVLKKLNRPKLSKRAKSIQMHLCVPLKKFRAKIPSY